MVSPIDLPESFKMNSALQAPLQIPRRGLRPPSGALDCAPARALGLECPPSPRACEPALRDFSGSYVAVLYLNVALAMGLAQLVSAGEYAALLACPVWSAALLAHGLACDPGGFFCAVGLAVVYPILIIVRDPGLHGSYLLLFAAFASKGFWAEQRGVWLVACVVYWAGVLAGVAGGVLAPDGAPWLEAAAFCALVLAAVCTRRLARFRWNPSFRARFFLSLKPAARAIQVEPFFHFFLVYR